MNRFEFINWFEDVRLGTRRLITVVTDDAFEFRAYDESPTIEQLMRSFAGLEEKFVKGVCSGDWSERSRDTDARFQQERAFAEETDDVDGFGVVEVFDTGDDILENLDMVHQEALDIIADLTDDEFQNRKVNVPWGEESTIQRFLIGMVEREIHHRTELMLALRLFGIRLSDQILWGP